MHAIPRAIAEQFAGEFAGNKKGFAAREITDYFSRYSNMVKPYEHYGVNPTRWELFIESLYMLLPKEQYYALTDLCLNTPPMRYPPPSEERRTELTTSLHSFLNPHPIGLAYSNLREHSFREDWYIAYNRVIPNPAAAVTAARTLLETVFKTIVTERRGEIEDPSNLVRLLRQAQEVLGFDRAARAEEHQVLTGLVSVVNGVAAMSNEAGDRHGRVAGVGLDSPALAGTVVNACGTVGLCFIEMHLLAPLPLADEAG
jgi:hypothetical protein